MKVIITENVNKDHTGENSGVVLEPFMEYAQMTGMILLFGLLIWANFNDVLRFLF